jgi:hypothetical protein
MKTFPHRLNAYAHESMKYSQACHNDIKSPTYTAEWEAGYWDHVQSP